MSLHHVAATVAMPDEDTKEEACNVGVDDRRPLAERKALDGPDGVLADSLERSQGLGIRG